MKAHRSLLLCCMMLAMSGVHAQADIPTAGEVMKKTYQNAVKENKKVLLIFHASWCGWCRKMDSALNDPSCKKFFDDNFVITHLVVLESADKKKLENKGADKLMVKYNYDEKDQGIPYWVILDNTGKLLFDCLARTKRVDGTVKSSNIGCPASEFEVKTFIDILKQTTPLKEDQLSIIAKRFRLNQ
jgi:thioredoxin-related protein